jgi:hypothetical protein
MAIMACGTLEGAMTIMQANNASLSDTAVTGATYLIPDDVPADAGVLQYLQQSNITTGTR